MRMINALSIIWLVTRRTHATTDRKLTGWLMREGMENKRKEENTKNMKRWKHQKRPKRRNFTFQFLRSVRYSINLD